MIRKIGFIIFLFSIFSQEGAWGQVEKLVSWEGYRDDWSHPTNNPTYYNNNDDYISAGVITGSNINFTTTYSRFEGGGSNGWPTSSAPDYSKYIQISISAKIGYQIELNKLQFIQDGWCNAYEIRFSKNSSFPSNGTFLYQNTNASATTNQNTNVYFPSNLFVESGETLYIRFYGYERDLYNDPWGLVNAPYNLQTETSQEKGPSLYGEISLSNTPPTAHNDNVSAFQNFPVNIDILENDIYSSINAITVTQQPAHSQNIIVNGVTNVTYIPNTNYTGTDSFKYTITDENGTSTEATVNITLNTPIPPTAVEDFSTIKINETTEIPILSNDNPGDGEFDYISIIANPTHGVLQINPNNTVSYTPNNNYLGNDSFLYKVTNSYNQSSSTVQVTLNIIDDPCLNCIELTSADNWGNIIIGNNEVYCIPNGLSLSAYITVQSGGVLCISGTLAGGSLAVNTGGNVNVLENGTIQNLQFDNNNSLNGTLTNHGTIGFSIYEGSHSGTINNYNVYNANGFNGNFTGQLNNYSSGNITLNQFQNFAGSLYNYGNFITNGTTAALNGSVIENFSEMTLKTIHFYGTTVKNYDGAILSITDGVNVYSGYWNNHLGGEVYCSGGNVNFTGDLDNSGYWEFERISGISSTLNNYGEMKVYNAANNISSTTYLTNDGLLEFINVPDVQYNGPMLTNNGTLTITHPSGGNFKMNQSINQVYNNGTIEVSGNFEQNADGSKLFNSCSINCETFFVGNGDAENSGFIWALQNIKIEGLDSTFFNEATGHVQGTNFTNSGIISGFGAFYFTGHTDMNSAGSFIGNEPNSILFYDVSQTGNNIFDASGGTVTNVMRPGSLSPYNLSTYNCSAPPSVAGYPPTTSSSETILCEPDIVHIDLENYVDPHPPVNGESFNILYSTLKLFEFENPTNPTNNSTTLTISGKGVLTANTTTGEIIFTPDPAFTSGIVEAEYRISNERNGDPIVYPSGRTKIIIHFVSIDLSPITIELGTNPVCTTETITLTNDVTGGTWSSSNESVATISNGIVTPISAGTTMISYSVTELGCEETVQQQIEVKVCGKFIITNPHIHQRVKGN